MRSTKKRELNVGNFQTSLKKIHSSFENFIFNTMSEAYLEKDLYDLLLIEEQNELLKILKLKS